MTKGRIVHCTNSNCPHEQILIFNDWVRENCPDSESGFMASDVDFVLMNYKTRKIMLLEIKTRSKQLAKWQRLLLNKLHKVLQAGLPIVDCDMEYLGMNLIVFENTSFDDGRCFLNHTEISEDGLREFLSF